MTRHRYDKFEDAKELIWSSKLNNDRKYIGQRET